MTQAQQSKALPFEKLEALQDLHLIATHFGLERFPYMAGLARNAQDELRRLNARIAQLEAAQERKPLTADQLADKCEAWLQAGGATNIVDAYEAGYRDRERAHGITGGSDAR